MPKALRSFRRRFIVIMALAASLLVLLATPAAAHTEFASSSPANGETLDQAVTEISLIFAGEATPAGEGFVVLDSEGFVRVPDEVTSTDNLTWTLRFVEPLVGGTVGVRWKVAAPDAHPIEGGFSFVVDTVAEQTTAVPVQPETVEDSATIDDAAAAVDLADFLDTGDASAANVARVGDVGRALSLVGVVLAFGGITFAALTLRGDRSDIRAVLFWVRRAGLVTMIGVIVEAVAQVATLSSAWSGLWSPSAIADALGSAFGVAVMLRLLGGALVLGGAKLDIHSAAIATDPVVAVKQLAQVGARSSMANTNFVGQGTRHREPLVHDGDEAWHIAESPAAFLGGVLLVASFLFDGHTVSEGPRWLHAVANAIHVSTAATWAGGVVMLAMVIARRHRRNADTRALQLAIRFSVVASIALIGAAVAGTALTVVILDSVSEIWSTPWGRLLAAKVLLVCGVAAGGAYNHQIVIPTLERWPNDKSVAHRFRTIVTVEAVGLILVTLLTAVLIAASST
jgi:copper transport protein